jgi:4'-phosphopantetheinyl transferase EntD
MSSHTGAFAEGVRGDVSLSSTILPLLRHLLPLHVEGEVCNVTDDRVPFVEEMNIVRKAVPKRRREFAAGRRAAHSAMRRLGLPLKPLLASRDRTPIWPPGVVGSISHTSQIAFAAVTSEAYLRSLGVDVEEGGALPSDIVARICVPSELKYLALWSAEVGGDAAKLLFSAKEAFYKSYYPIRRRFLEFLDVAVVLRPASSSFEISLVHDRSLDEATISGRFGWALGHVFSVVTIRPHNLVST